MGSGLPSSPGMFIDFTKETSDNFQMCVFEEGCGSVKETQADKCARAERRVGVEVWEGQEPSREDALWGVGGHNYYCPV